MSMRVETLYEVLGTNAHASAAEVKAAFKRQALVLHPDKGGSKEAFQRALRAFEVLSDDSSRSEYDQRLQKASRNRWSFQKTGAAGGQSRAGREAKGAEAPTPPRSRGRGRSCSGGGDPRARCADRTGRVPARRASGAGNAKSMDEVKMKRIQWSEEKKNLLMKKIFALLQKVSASRRRHLLESWTPRHRRALEAWCLTSQDARGRCRAPAPALAAPAAPAAAGAAGAGSGAAEWPDAGTAELRSSDRRQMRGIASFYHKGTVFYQVSLCIQSLCMTARKVRELDRAVDILLMLMSIKQKMGGIVDPSLFVQKMTDAVPAAFEEYGVTAEEMGLRFQVMMCMRFWVRPPLHTPQQAKLEDALQAWSRLTRFRSPLGQGARGFARMDLKELEERWRAFREVYLDILTEGGPSDQSRRFNASRRLDALAEASRPQRERRCERWNRLAMQQEDRPWHRSKKAAHAFDRAQLRKKRSIAMQEAAQVRPLRRRSAARAGLVRSSRPARTCPVEAQAVAQKRLMTRLARLLTRWDASHRRGVRIMAGLQKAAARESAQEKQKEAQAAQQALRQKRAAEAEARSLERAAAKRQREEHRNRWKWLNRKDITMEELLHSKGCHVEASFSEGSVPDPQSPLIA